MISDSVGDLITRIRNAQMAKKATVDSPMSNLREAVVKVLKNEGYISDYSIVDDEKSSHKLIRIDLKYYNNQPVIAEIKRISKPGRRVYSSISKLPALRNGLGIYILSTNCGVISDVEARKRSVGGEILCSVF